MAKFKADDIAAIAALLPVVGSTVGSIVGLFRLMRRMRGEPEVQPGDEEAAQQILIAVRAETVQQLEQAKDPWKKIREIADAQLHNANL